MKLGGTFGAFFALTFTALILLTDLSAHAHGESPQLMQVLFHPSDPDVVVIVASFGLLVTEDGGAGWDWVCPEAIAGDITLLGRGFIDSEGTVTLGLPQGVLRGEALGCDWSRPSAELDGVYVSDLHADPADRSFALALTFERDDTGRVFRTDDAGQTWVPRAAPLPARLLTQSVRAAPSDPLRVYVTGVDPSDSRPFVFRSDFGGDVWERFDIAAQPGEFAFLLLGVDPSSRDRVYMRALEANLDRIAVSDDDALTFRDLETLDAPPLAVGRPFGFAIGPDGAVWLGSTVAGLRRVEGAGLLSVRTDLPVTCIETQGDDLWICLDGRAGDSMAELVRAPAGDTDALEPVMSYEQMSGVRSCPSAPAVREICEPLWDDLRRHVELLPPLDPPDAGAQDSGMDTAPPGGCGCRVGARSEGGSWLLAILLLAGLGRRRRASKTAARVSP